MSDMTEPAVILSERQTALIAKALAGDLVREHAAFLDARKAG